MANRDKARLRRWLKRRGMKAVWGVSRNQLRKLRRVKRSI